MEDTWASRELPVLEAVVSQVDEVAATGGYPEAEDVADRTGMPLADVLTALNALDGDFIALHRSVDPSGWYVTSVTSLARRSVGQWPTGENLIGRLTAGLAQAAEQEEDPERKKKLMLVARELGGAVKTIAINVATEMLEHRLPH
jgi:hypothetical protein